MTRQGARRARATIALALTLATVAGCCAASATTVAAPASTAAPSTTMTSPSSTPSMTATVTASASPTATKAARKAIASPHPTARKAAPARFRFPVPVSAGSATQIITVQAHGSYATVIAWQFYAGGWHKMIATSAGRVGANGVVPGTQRVQGSNTTPAGTYTLTQAFGIKANPGARLPYHQLTSDDWWVEDNNSAYYNQPRRASQGGFDVTEAGVNGSEHLITLTVPYQYVVVIDFNRWPAVRYRGAGIFLHVNGSSSTAGCVSVPLSTMVAIMRWLSPAAHPRIAIA